AAYPCLSSLRGAIASGGFFIEERSRWGVMARRLARNSESRVGCRNRPRKGVHSGDDRGQWHRFRGEKRVLPCRPAQNRLCAVAPASVSSPYLATEQCPR